MLLILNSQSSKTRIEEIKEDISKSYAMNRLMQGDVGSGKTIIAILAAAISVSTNFRLQ